jgi:hypothetical protein
MGRQVSVGNHFYGWPTSQAKSLTASELPELQQLIDETISGKADHSSQCHPNRES